MIAALIRATSFSDASPLALPKAIEKRKREWVVRRELETVDGAPCVVIERKGKDTIWIDPDHGFVPRRRIYNEDSGNPLLEVQNRDLVERAPGLWLPNEQIILRYRPDSDPPASRGKLFRKDVNRIVNISFDLLPDSFFDVPLPTENAFVFDQIRGIYYPVHEKGTTTEGIVARALSKSQESIDFRDSKEMAIRWTLWAVAIGLALMLLALQIRRLIARS
jgi:hypothetical protein